MGLKKKSHGGRRPGAGRPSTGQTTNLNLRLDPATLERARRIAAERGLPLSEVVRRFLRDLPED